MGKAWRYMGYLLLFLNLGLMVLCAYLFTRPDAAWFIQVETFLVGFLGLWNFVRITVALEDDGRH